MESRNNKKSNSEKSTMINVVCLDYDGTVANSEPLYYVVSAALVATFYNDNLLRNFFNNNDDNTLSEVAIEGMKKYDLDVWNSTCAGDAWNAIHMQNLSELANEEQEKQREKEGKYYPKIFNKIYNFIYENRENKENLLKLLQENKTLYKEYKAKIESNKIFYDFLNKSCSEVFIILANKMSEMSSKYWFEIGKNIEQKDKKLVRKQIRIQKKESIISNTKIKSLFLDDNNELLNKNSPDGKFDIIKKFSQIPYLDIIAGFEDFFNNKQLHNLAIVTSSSSVDISFKILSNIRLLEKFNDKNKYKQAIDTLKSMLPSAFFIKQDNKLTNKLKNGVDIQKEIVDNFSTDPCNEYVSYYKTNRISYEDVENLIKIYLCNKKNEAELIKDDKLKIKEYEKNKDLFDSEKWANIKIILDKMAKVVSLNKNKPYGSYKKPNPIMHVLNLIFQILDSKKNGKKIDYEKIILTIVEDSGSVDAVSEVERAFGQEPSSICSEQKKNFNLKDDELQKRVGNLFIEIGLIDEYIKIKKAIVVDGIYLTLGNHISIKNLYKTYTKNNNANFNTANINDFFQRNKKMSKLSRAEIMYKFKSKNKIDRSDISRIRNLNKFILDSKLVNDLIDNKFGAKKIIYDIFLKDEASNKVIGKSKKKDLYNNRKKVYNNLFQYKIHHLSYERICNLISNQKKIFNK